jgi:hypothetical protein
MSPTKIVIYDAKLHTFLNTNKSADVKTLWKYLELGKAAALFKAKAQVGVKTGALRRSISAYHLGNSTGQYVGLRATRPYAYVHHQGSKKHVIEPRGTNQLIFRGRSGVIATYHVNHPGTKPNRFLKDQMREFGKIRFGR